MTVKDLRRNVRELLEQYMVDEADVIGDIVCASVLDTDRSGLYLRLEDEVSNEVIVAAEDMIRKLMTGMPIQYVLGECYFYGLPIKISSGCFIPRSDTELLVTEAVELLPDGGSFADICTGSGCISKAIAANRSDVSGLALDYYHKPLQLAKQNLEEYENVSVERFDALEIDDYEIIDGIDVVICNPPYIPSDELLHLDTNVQYEPETALDGGEDGLKFYRAVTEYSYPRIAEGGALLFEAGINQADDVEAMLIKRGFETYIKEDLGGIARLVAGIKPIDAIDDNE